MQLLLKLQFLFQALEVIRHLGSRLIALLSLFSERAAYDCFELRGRTGQRRRLSIEYSDDHIGNGRACEWQAAGYHLVSHNAEAEYVCPRIYLQPSHLFGRHIAGRSYDNSLFRVEQS